MSSAESAVVSRVEAALAQRSSALLGVDAAQDFSTLPHDLETYAGEAQTALTQFRAKKARAQSSVQIELTNAHTDYERAFRDYRAFRKSHALTETEPSYDNVFWRKVFWLALMFTIEVAANGWVIGQASQGGLVQGWTTALMISILVVLTGTLVGMGPWRYLNYRGHDGRGRLHMAWAVPCVIIGGLALLLFAFYVAHYRYALSHAALDAPAPDNILTSIATNPFQPFQQLESLLLFTVALLIGIFAVARGAHWDDPYPGYGPRHRRMEDARERTRETAQSLSAQIDAAKDAADATLNDLSNKSQSSVGALRQALGRSQDNASAWDTEAADIINVGREAIGIYRDANEDARSDHAPGYFASDPFGNPASGMSIVDGLDSTLARCTAAITQCKSQIAGARAQLEAEYHSFYDDELAPFLKGVATRAAARVQGEFADPDEARALEAEAEIAANEVEEEQEVVPLRRSRTRR